ncbi:MAG: hypothetical protein AAF587_12255 [Bacteroidota bacterium]
MKSIALSTFFLISTLATFSQKDSFPFERERELIPWTIYGDYTFAKPDTSETSREYLTLGKNGGGYLDTISLVYSKAIRSPGNMTFQYLAQGGAAWKVEVFTTDQINANDLEEGWKKHGTGLDIKIRENTNENVLRTFSKRIRSLGNKYLKIKISQLAGSGQLYLGNVVITKVTDQDREIIALGRKLEQIESEKRTVVNRAMRENDYQSGRILIEDYKKNYKARIQTLGMLVGKSISIQLIAEMGAAIGAFNQVANPVSYETYGKLKNELMPNLDKLSKEAYNDQVEGKLVNIFEKLKDPLNLLVGAADILSGGGVSKVIDGFKGMVVTAYSVERIVSLFGRKERAQKEEQGLELYKEAKEFLNSIEEENKKILVYNRRLISIDQQAEAFNGEVISLLKEYLSYVGIKAEDDVLNRMVANETYAQFDDDIDAHFSLILGTPDTYDAYKIALQAKHLDQLFYQVSNLTDTKYQNLSGELTNFYGDIQKLSEACPLKRATPADQKNWEDTIRKVKRMFDGTQDKYSTFFTQIDFYTAAFTRVGIN